MTPKEFAEHCAVMSDYVEITMSGVDVNLQEEIIDISSFVEQVNDAFDEEQIQLEIVYKGTIHNLKEHFKHMFLLRQWTYD